MFVGMDVHKNYLQVAVLDENGKILNNSRVDNNLIKVNEFFDSLHPNNIQYIAYVFTRSVFVIIPLRSSLLLSTTIIELMTIIFMCCAHPEVLLPDISVIVMISLAHSEAQLFRTQTRLN
jgi:hypothetical protein